MINQKIRNQLKTVYIFHPIIMVCFFTPSLIFTWCCLATFPITFYNWNKHALPSTTFNRFFWASMHLFSKPPSRFCSIIGRQFIAWVFSSTKGRYFVFWIFGFCFIWYLVGIYCVSQEKIKSHPTLYVQ